MIDSYVETLNRYSTAQIAEIFQVTAAEVETWKAGQDDSALCQKEAVVRVLSERGTPLA